MILILLTNLILLHRFQWRIVEAMLLLENRYRDSLVCHEALPQSQRIARFHHDAILLRETNSNFSCRSARNFIGSLRLRVHLRISFPLLRRPSTVIIPLWVACWGEAFHELLMIIVSNHSVHTDIRSPWSLHLDFHNFSSTGLLKSRMIRATAPLQQSSSLVAILLWLVLLLNRVEIVSPFFRAHCGTEMADIEQAQQMIPLITCESSFWLKCQRVGFLVSTYFILIFFVQINWIEQPIKSNSVGPGNMSHCGTPSFNDHLDHCFISQTQSTKLLYANTGRLREHNQYYSTRWSSIEIFANQIPWIESGNPVQPQSNVQRDDFGICWTDWLWSVSSTSNLLEQMYDFRERKMFHLGWILSLQDLPRNRSLRTIPVRIVLQYYHKVNTVRKYMCDDCMISIDSSVCHKFWSISWWILQVYSLTIENQVFQFVPSVKNFRTIWEHTFDNSPMDFNSSSLKRWSSMHGVHTL